MTASRASLPPSALLPLAVVLLGLVIGGARAQQAVGIPAPGDGGVSKPMSLAPPTALTPRASEAEAAATAAGEAGNGIRVNRLDTLDPDSVGLLRAGNGGLGGDLWQGSKREFVDQVLPHLPTDAPSAAMRDLMRRLLLTAARAPVGQGRPGDLVATRARLLVALGDAHSAADLIAATPVRGDNGLLNRAESDPRFLTYDLAPACRVAAAQVGQGHDLFWQKSLTFCQALAGEADKAALGVGLLREMDARDPTFFDLMAALESGRPAKLKVLDDPSPLHLAMARAAKSELPPAVLIAGNAAVLQTVARNGDLSAEMRLEAAERALSGGTPLHETLRELYAGLPFQPDELANPLTTAEQLGGTEARALLYRAAREQTIPTARAEALAKALELAQADGRFGTVARAFLDVLETLNPAPELAWLAPEAARALMVLGRGEQARRWLTLVRAAARGDEDMARARAALLPLVLIAGLGDGGDWDRGGLTGWWRGAREDPATSGRAGLLLTLLDALGETVPSDLWAQVVDLSARTDAVLPDTAVLRLLARAAEAPRGHVAQVASTSAAAGVEAHGRVGETAMLALIALGPQGPRGAYPELLHRVLSSLVRVGLVEEARRLALEAAMASGL